MCEHVGFAGAKGPSAVCAPNLDRLVAIVTLPAWGSLVIGLAALVRLVDGPPAFFVQARVGLERREFRVFKLRTMRDGKITRVGRWLRRAGLDELPQLWQIARGQMRFVGPRPITRADVERLGWTTEDHDLRWRVLPGLTGPVQLSAVCDRDVSWQLDSSYVLERSLWLDLEILARSALVPLLGKPERWTLRPR